MCIWYLFACLIVGTCIVLDRHLSQLRKPISTSKNLFVPRLTNHDVVGGDMPCPRRAHISSSDKQANEQFLISGGYCHFFSPLSSSHPNTSSLVDRITFRNKWAYSINVEVNAVSQKQ